MKKQKKITQKEVRKHLSYKPLTGILKWKIPTANRVKIESKAGTENPDGYIKIQFKGKIYLAQRLIWFGMKGYFPENDIDHKDRIKNNNKWKNLRETSRSCNMKNTGIRSTNKSGITGISWNKRENRWEVQIMTNKKKSNLGKYKDFDEAVCHRLAAEQCLDWEKCNPNSPAYLYVKENIQ